MTVTRGVSIRLSRTATACRSTTRLSLRGHSSPARVLASVRSRRSHSGHRFDVGHHDVLHLLVDVDSRDPIRHRSLLRGERRACLVTQSGSRAIVGSRGNATMPNYSFNHARPGSNSCLASTHTVRADLVGAEPCGMRRRIAAGAVKMDADLPGVGREEWVVRSHIRRPYRRSGCWPSPRGSPQGRTGRGSSASVCAACLVRLQGRLDRVGSALHDVRIHSPPGRGFIGPEILNSVWKFPDAKPADEELSKLMSEICIHFSDSCRREIAQLDVSTTLVLRGGQQPVAKSVPNTQPITPKHPKSFHRSELPGSIPAAPFVRRRSSRQEPPLTSTTSVAWPEPGEFESQTGLARHESCRRVRFRPAPRVSRPARPIPYCYRMR